MGMTGEGERYGEGMRWGVAGRDFKWSMGEKAVQDTPPWAGKGSRFLFGARLVWAGQGRVLPVLLCTLCSLSSVSSTVPSTGLGISVDLCDPQAPQ